jgi:RNA polymerase sigma-70 factor (ECF subfamily)
VGQRPGADSHAGGPAIDAASFADRFARCAPAVHAWALLNVQPALRTRLDPDDVVQEVAVRAMQNVASFDPSRAEFRTWLFGIARNVLYQALERLARGERSSADVTGASAQFANLIDTTTGITRRLRRDETFQRLVEKLASLPEEERRLVLYRGLEGLSHDEVAARLGLSADAATKRWQRLRERLQHDASILEFAAG